jgi:serine/threonine protein kinase
LFIITLIITLIEELWLVLELCDGGSLLEVAEILKERGEGFHENEIKFIIAYRLFNFDRINFIRYIAKVITYCTYVINNYSLLGLEHLHDRRTIHRVKSDF